MSKAQEKIVATSKELERALNKNDSNPQALSELLHRAETLVAEQLPEKHEHTPLNKKMSDFTRRNSVNPDNN